MVSLIRLAFCSATTLRPTTFFSKVNPHTRCHLHKKIFSMPSQWQRTLLVRSISTAPQTAAQTLRQVVIQVASQKYSQIKFDPEAMRSLTPAYAVLNKSYPTHADCLIGLLMDTSEKAYNKEDPEWEQLQKLVNELDPSVIAETFQRLYLDCTYEGKNQAIYPALALFKLFTGHLLNLPKKEECSLDCFTKHVKEVILSLPLAQTNPKRMLEFFLCVKPLNLRSLFWFYLPEQLIVDFKRFIKGYDDSIL